MCVKQKPQPIHDRVPDLTWLGLAAALARFFPPSEVPPELKLAIDRFISDNKIVLFIKGTKQFPQCGFSNTCVQILNTLSAPYETVDVLESDALRNGLKVNSMCVLFDQSIERERKRKRIRCLCMCVRLCMSPLQSYSQWPTFPQCYIDGEFVGGCDILIGRGDQTRTRKRGKMIL